MAKKQNTGPALPPKINDVLFLFSIELQEAVPPIRRRFIVPATLTFSQFHDVIQEVMGWFNCHLYEFATKNARFGPVHRSMFGDDDDTLLDADENRLSEVFHRRNLAMQYTYDFGDNWVHRLKLEDTLYELPSGATQPVFCLDGSGACPPEDVGGVYGYMDFCEIAKNPDNEQYKEMMAWYRDQKGIPSSKKMPAFDPEYFDVDSVNASLAKHFAGMLAKAKRPAAGKQPLRIVGNAAPPESTLDAAKELIARVQQDSSLSLPRELAALLAKHPDAPAVFARLVAGLHGEKETGPVGAILSVLCTPECFPKKSDENMRQIVPALRAVITGGSASAEGKITAVSILDVIGQPLTDQEIATHVPEYQPYLARQFEKTFQEMTDTPERIASLLAGYCPDMQDSGVAPERMRAFGAFGKGMLAVNPAGAVCIATALTALAGLNSLKHDDEALVRALAESPSPRALWCLQALAEWPLPERFQTLVRQEADHMAKTGVTPEPPESPDAFSHAFLTMCDGMGSRTVGVFRNPSDGETGEGVNGVCVLLNDGAGIKDVISMFGDANTLEDMYKNAGDDISFAGIALKTAREILADSLALHRELNTSPPGILFPLLPFFGGAVAPARRMASLDAYKLDGAALSPELVKGSESLARTGIFATFLPDSDEAYRFCQRHKKRNKLPPEAFEQFVREVAVQEKETLLRRMAVNLEVEALAGRAAQKANKQGAKLWLGLRENVVPWEENPFVRELSRQAVETIIRDLGEGYSSRGEKFAAEQEMEEAFFNTMSQLMEANAIGEEDAESLMNTGLGMILDAMPADTHKRGGKRKGKNGRK